MDKTQVQPLIDYIHHVKFGAQTLPDFSMKGRTATSLLRLMTEWHDEVNREQRVARYFTGYIVADATWNAIPVRNFEYKEGGKEGKSKLYVIRQLTSSKALATNSCCCSAAPHVIGSNGDPSGSAIDA